MEKIGISEKFIEIPPCFMETININEDEDDIVIKLSDSSSSENDNIKNNVNSKVILEDDSSNLNEGKENMKIMIQKIMMMKKKVFFFIYMK